MFNIKRVHELERINESVNQSNANLQQEVKRLTLFISENCYFRNKKGQIEKCK